MRLLRVREKGSGMGCTTDLRGVPCGALTAVSAPARELAQPGRDGLLIAERLTAPGGAGLAGADRVGLGHTARARERGSVRRVRRHARTGGLPLRVGGERHRARTYL